MNSFKRLTSMALIAGLLLAACGGTPAAESPTAAPTSAPAAQPTAAEPTVGAQPAAPTPTFEPVTDDEPTVGVVQGSGALAWRDQVLRNDSAIISVSGLAPPESGQTYAAWISGKDSSLALGKLSGSGDTLTLTYVSPTNANLLGAFERVYITKGPEAEATAEIKNVVLTGALPEQALVHIRHVLFSIGNTPGEIGFALGLRQETDELLRHAQFLKDALDAGDFPLVKVHAEHIANIIGGSEARDANGDGKIQNPGDGFGLLPNGQQDGYIKGMVDHARLAGEAADATEAIKLHAGHAQVAGENTRLRIQDIRDRADKIAAAGGIAETQQDVLTILALAQQTIQGADTNLDEQVGPIPGEGGVLTAYQHAQLMAGIPLAPGAGAQAQAPAPAPTQAAAAVPETFTVEVGDNTFTPNKITVPLGATVVWTSAGQRPHTVTADDGAFKSDTLNNGGTFEQLFDTPGTFAYYCEFHGGPGGQAMAAVVKVGDGGAPAQQAPPPTEPAPPPTTAPAAQPTAAPAAAPAEVKVSMKDFDFAPKEIRVKAGTKITWANDGAAPHSATAADKSFDTALFQSGEAKSVTFSTPGTFAYYCQLHGTADGNGMAGTVVVEP